MKDGQDPAVG